jgi:hypothetical protein
MYLGTNCSFFNRFYDISDCGGSPVNYDAVVNKECVPLSETLSFQVDYPIYIFYNSSNACTGYSEAFPYFVGETCTSFESLIGGRKLVETESMPTYYDVFPMGYFTTSALMSGTSAASVASNAHGAVAGASTTATTSVSDASSLAGLAIGIFLGVGLIGAAALFCMLRGNSKKADEDAEPLNEKN